MTKISQVESNRMAAFLENLPELQNLLKELVKEK